MNKQLNITIGLGAGYYHLQLQSTILETKLIVGLLAMAESPMVGARVPQNRQKQVSAIAAASGRKEAEIVREALGQYLSKNDPGSVKRALDSLEDRVADLERKLARNGRLVGE